MAVYTKISKRDVSSLVNDYQINEVKKSKSLAQIVAQHKPIVKEIK